jgi:uncharacterized protein YndB with AHSA1/START domain
VDAPTVDRSIVIAAPATTIIRAFFDPDALGTWWQVARSVTTARPLGAYAVEWPPTDFRDEVLGRLGGVFRGIVIDIDLARGFFVADAYWLPPDGEPIGPMALEVTTAPVTGATRVRVKQTGFEESARWRKYYEIIGIGWDRALAALKDMVEGRWRG